MVIFWVHQIEIALWRHPCAKMQLTAFKIFEFFEELYRWTGLDPFLTCVSHTAHVCGLSVRLSVRHALVLCRNGSNYRQTVFTAW